ncbi:MAG: hypothetical protein QW568_05400, partial [Candidatus Anstonellaceae archaeon]
MNWEKFLQPTFAKLALASLLFIVFVPFLEIDTGIRCITVPCLSSQLNTILSYHLFYFQHTYVRPHIYQILYINIVLGLLLSYFASCALLSSRTK